MSHTNESKIEFDGKCDWCGGDLDPGQWSPGLCCACGMRPQYEYDEYLARQAKVNESELRMEDEGGHPIKVRIPFQASEDLIDSIHSQKMSNTSTKREEALELRIRELERQLAEQKDEFDSIMRQYGR